MNAYKWTRRAVLAGLGGIVSTGAYAGLVEPYWRLRTTNYRLSPRRWPAGLGLRIAAIADPHVNLPFVTPSHMSHVAALVAEQKPDVIVLLGDYLSSLAFSYGSLTPREIARCFADLRAPLGVFAILGNHDWWEDPEVLKRPGQWPPVIARELMAVGIPVLENEAVRIVHDGQPLWLLGLGDQWSAPLGGRRFHGRDDLPATLAKVVDDAPAILLAHEPDIFPQVPNRIALTLSGHTHGGQITFLGYAPVVPSKYGQRYRYGLIEEQDRLLVVSSGIGMSGLPLRLGMPPEIVIIDLGEKEGVRVARNNA